MKSSFLLALLTLAISAQAAPQLLGGGGLGGLLGTVLDTLGGAAGSGAGGALGGLTGAGATGTNILDDTSSSNTPVTTGADNSSNTGDDDDAGSTSNAGESGDNDNTAVPEGGAGAPGDMADSGSSA